MLAFERLLQPFFFYARITKDSVSSARTVPSPSSVGAD
jgi:hypothetical protein